ncbi:LysR family transcriptional regulator [Thermomonas sp. HDW16]|uniref:LysR family transcriptional regulator n=1 Tax=Thermomonas sp. HDW16 TaxID=2714945 RepID=UPI00140AA938|nr:LysR family transcriptional regulator [Thermomonas sp. HDW16]QIL19386.1 LysR family transcriptional regulator [Thermomonas sp. HDW16]
MDRQNLSDLVALLAVAEERSFTKAAAKLGTSQSSLSHTVRRLEARLGVRLLSRSTRSVSPTAAGEELIATLKPALLEIDAKIGALGDLRDKPAGIVRITTSRHAAQTVLIPALSGLMAEYPDIHVELDLDGTLVDIVADRFDAGVRLGEQLANDMIAVRIGPDLRQAVVGSPAYFKQHPIPQSPHELTAHRCINLRLPTHGGLYAWEFSREGRELNVRVDGAMVVNDSIVALDAAIQGIGLACLMEDVAAPALADGRLVRILDAWCEPFPGYHLYYPSRRQPSLAFSLVVQALRYPA